MALLRPVQKVVTGESMSFNKVQSF